MLLQRQRLQPLCNLPSGCYRFRGSPSFQREQEQKKNLQIERRCAYDPCVGHTVRSRTSSHVVRVQSTTCSTTRSHREIRLAGEYTLFLICTSYRVLETSRVGRVTCDRHVNSFFPHDSYTFANIICAIAFYLGTRTL